MTNSRRNQGHSSGGARWKSIMILSVVVLAMGYSLWPSSVVKLDDNGYEVTIALYRVCNQQSEKGLDEIAEVLRRVDEVEEERTPQQFALDSIIADARDGRWASATRACRKLLEDQVDRK